MQEQVRKAQQHNQKWEDSEQYRQQWAAKGWIWGMKGNRTEPWVPLAANDEPPTSNLIMSDTDVFTIIGLQVIGTQNNVILERDSDDYKRAMAHLEYGLNLKTAFVLCAVEAERTGNFEAVARDMAKDARERCLTSSAVRKPSGKGVWEPESEVFEHWLHIVCDERTRWGIWLK